MMEGDTITIHQTGRSQFTVHARGRMQKQLNWDETLGCVAALIIPSDQPLSVPYLQTPMQSLLDDIRWCGLMEVFGGAAR